MSFLDVVYKATSSLRVLMSLALLIEVLSSLQIIQLIISSMAKFSPSSHFIITSLSKNLRFFTGAFPLEEVSGENPIFYFIWIACLIYFSLHILLLIIILVFKKSQGNQPIKILSWLFLLHSRVFFFPIQFFLLNLCNLYSYSKTPSNAEFYQEAGWLAGSVVLLVVNSALSLCKEFLMYQINHIEEDSYAVKTNIYHQTMLLYKLIALLLYYWGLTGASSVIKGSTVFHLVMGSFLLFVLYMKLPFYKFQVLKLTILLTTVILCLSIVSVVYVFVEDTDSETTGGLHILLLLFPTLGIKLTLSQFQNLFKRILQGKFMNGDHAIHYGLLLEDFLMKEKMNRQGDGALLPNRESYYGALALAGNIPLEKFTDRRLINECESPIYLHIIEKLSLMRSSSRALALYVAEICLLKGDNIPKTLEIMRKLEAGSGSSSLPLQNSIRYLNDLLEKVYKEDDFGSDLRLSLSHYFKYYNVANFVKTLMLKETTKQIEFWEEVQKRNLDAKKIYDKVEEIDKIFVRIRKECEFNLNSFRKNFTSPMLLYSVYLNNVRQMHHEGVQILRSFESIMFAQSGRNELEAASGNIAVVIVSLDKARAGVILNASGSIHNLFNYKKTELIGKKLGSLFPSSIAKIYQQSIQQYVKAPEYKLNYKEKTYGKTSNDEIFELEAHFQLYPYVNKELTLMVIMKKIDDPAPILISNGEGMIVDCSKTLELLFQKESLNLKVFNSLRNINSGLEEVNLAFNVVYGGQNQQQILSVRSTKTWFNFENTAVDYEESSRCTGRSLLRGLTFSPEKAKKYAPAIGMPFDKAELMCEEYLEGKQIIIRSEKESHIRAQMSIKPFRAEEEIYKIVKISYLKKEVGSLFESSENNTGEDDEFPAEHETVIVSPLKTPKTKGAIGSSFVVKEKTAWIAEPSESATEKNQDQADKTQKKLNDLQPLWDQDDHRSSIMSSHHIESRTVRTLRDIGSRRKLQRSLWSLQIALYFVIAVVLVLSFVKFQLSKSSIEEIEKGISIINLATFRLQNAINVWLWALIYATGVRSSEAIVYLRTSMAQFTEYSIQLEHKLGLMTNQDFLNRAFQKDVKFWQLPVEGDTENEMRIDTFAATNILMGKYLEVQETQSIYEVYMIPDLLLTFNNTANDYLLSSEDFISATDAILGEIISRDNALLKVVLSIEIVALVSFIGIFIMMISIISKSYERLCRALGRTQDGAITQRISQLQKVKTLLEDDIERKAFIQDGFDLFIEERSPKRLDDAKAQKITYQSHLHMSSMKKYLLRIALICLLFIPAFGASFIGALVKSIHTFTTLESVNEKLSVLSDGSLQSNLLVSTMVYTNLNQANPSMLIMNQNPMLQNAKNLANFNGLNQRLIKTFLSSKKGDIDSYLAEILQSNPCKHLSDVSKAVCESTINNQKMGLLSMNVDYYNTLGTIFAAVDPNTTFAEVLVAYAGVLDKILGEMSVMMEIYPIMMSHVFEGFEETVGKAKNDEGGEIIVIFVTAMVYIVFIYVKPLKHFQNVDVGRRKVLKIIPFSLIQENKALKFYLMQDFKTEVEEIKNKL